MEIYVNQVYGFVKQRGLDVSTLTQKDFKDLFRVIAIFKNEAAVIDLDKKQAVPYWIDISEIEYMMSDGILFLIEEPFVLPTNEENISDVAKQRRDKIAPIIIPNWNEHKMELLDKSKRNKRFHKIAKENSLSFNMVRRSLCNFWQKGMVENALILDYSRCGGYGTRKMEKNSYKKLGAKRKPRLGKEQPQGVKVTADDIKKFNKALKSYNKKDCKTLKQTYNNMRAKMYRKTLYDSNGKIIGTEKMPLSEVPSYRQFLYWYKEIRDMDKEIIGRHGYSAFMRNFRPLSGISLSGVVGPGSQYQIDSTIADIYIQMEHGDMVFGRPVIYSLTDTFTGMIAAIHISVNPASWTEASSCLLNMVEDKVDFCKRFDIEITEEMWPSKFLPSSIITDRGEFVSDKTTNFTKFTGIELKHTPPFRPDLKGVVEQKFNIYNEPTKRFLPGAVRKGYGDRGERRPELDATLTLREFTKIIIGLVLKHNNSGHRRMQGAKEVRIIPTVEWEYGIKNRSGALKVVSNMNAYKLSLMSRAKGTINRYGLVWDGLLYDYFKREELGHSKEFAYDKRDMTTIYLPNKDWTDYQAISLKGDSRKYKGLSFDEIQFAFDIINDQNALIEQEDMEKNVDSIDLINQAIEESNRSEEKYNKPATQSEIINGKRVRRQAASIKYNKGAAIRPEKPENQDKLENQSSRSNLEQRRRAKDREKIENAMKLQQEQMEKENRNE